MLKELRDKIKKLGRRVCELEQSSSGDSPSTSADITALTSRVTALEGQVTDLQKDLNN